MRYRAMDSNGDYQFGFAGVFFVNSPAAVAQAILTRLRLMTGEWFLDSTDGTNYKDKVLGYGTQGTRDVEVRTRILDTQGVTSIVSYTSNVDEHRNFTASALVQTQYGVVQVTI